MFVDHRGLHPGNLCPCCEGVERQVAEMVGIPYRDVDEEIVFATHVVDAHDLRQREQVRTEGFDQVAGVPCHADRDECLQANTERFRVDTRTVPSQYAVALQAPDTLEA